MTNQFSQLQTVSNQELQLSSGGAEIQQNLAATNPQLSRIRRLSHSPLELAISFLVPPNLQAFEEGNSREKHSNDHHPGLQPSRTNIQELKMVRISSKLRAPSQSSPKGISAHLKRSIARRIAARSMLNRAANRLIKINPSRSPSHRCG